MPNKAWTPGFLLLVGLVATLEARKLTLGELRAPGPGFFPFYLALAFSFVALVLLVRSFTLTGERQNDSHPKEPLRRRRVAWTLLGLFGYAFGLEPLGFLIATFLLMLFLYRVIEPQRWLLAIGGSFATTLVAYVLFRLLQVRLPTGLWAP